MSGDSIHSAPLGRGGVVDRQRTCDAGWLQWVSTRKATVVSIQNCALPAVLLRTGARCWVNEPIVRRDNEASPAGLSLWTVAQQPPGRSAAPDGHYDTEPRIQARRQGCRHLPADSPADRTHGRVREDRDLALASMEHSHADRLKPVSSVATIHSPSRLRSGSCSCSYKRQGRHGCVAAP